MLTRAPGPRRNLPVEIGPLSHVEVQAPGPLEPDRLPLATELVVYLAAHPDGVHTNVLTGRCESEVGYLERALTLVRG